MEKLLKTYLTSLELKKTIVRRSVEYDIPLRYICADIGVGYKHFMATYINGSGEDCNMSVSQFEKMLESLGISVRFQFVVQQDFKAEAIKKRLKDKYVFGCPEL